ncbi:DUF262 domain-containing protein [Clavibacter nebraskensis]|uniref:DUF262 domain-containing protein n=1 Tax=Clavibacter nebraskensis TaxID=31963 RepID=UPI0012F82513|nr:DUF262 domain-containing protein [Clavibacter nebraskensis]QGV67289.1 DUF262 domain-containing protein [Clavibacter nebraskensis]
MAIPAAFGHDNIGHLLSDKLLTVPRFQRGYSWVEQNVLEFWSDINRARQAGSTYFMGTVVLAVDLEHADRMLIVDGQQRLTTTAILLIAIRDRLNEFELGEQWRSVQREYLADYVLSQESHKPKLVLSPADSGAFEDLLDIDKTVCAPGPVFDAYTLLRERIEALAPDKSDYAELLQIVEYLATSVQVLTATATDLSEAFVIFETLNDRGADLTTADLLKNFLFSQAGSAKIRAVEEAWVRISGAFSKSTDFVRFIRFEHVSRKGQVTMRGLYKAIQGDIPVRTGGVMAYLDGLERALSIYTALKEPDDVFWSANSVGVKDSLLAFRRLGLESNSPLLLAAFAHWNTTDATRLVNVVANWSVRAWAAGNLGGGTAEKAFSEAAVAIADGSATAIDELRPFMKGVVPDDSGFRAAFLELGELNTTTAKYLLGQLERQSRQDRGANTDALPDWASRTVTVEHIIAKSSKESDFDSANEYQAFEVARDRVQNLTPLEKSLNAEAKDGKFETKSPLYLRSEFELTKLVGESPSWSSVEGDARNEALADIAIRAWPY